MESMESSGHSIQMLLCCGGLSKNKLFVQTQADVTGEEFKFQGLYEMLTHLMMNS